MAGPDRALATLATTALALLAFACGGPEGGREEGAADPGGAGGIAADLARERPAGGCRGDILLLTIDTLRPDHLSLYGYPRPTSPNLDRRFSPDRAAVFTRAYSTATSTPQSAVSLLSGRLPQEHRVRLFYQPLKQEIPLLPDLLPACYQSAAFVSNTVLADEAVGLAHRFDHYDDFPVERQINPEATERWAGPTTEAVLEWLRAERDPLRPLFLWVHYMDPHGPYKPPSSWKRTFTHGEPVPIEPTQAPAYLRIPGERDGLAYVDLYDEEIAYLDAELERMLAGYAARYPVDDALLLFTADHGESMMEHERWFTHGYFVYEEIVRVPLIVRGPGVEPGLRRELSSGIDVAPTVLAFAGAALPPELPDVDLATGRGLGAERAVFTETYKLGRQWRAVHQGSGKWMVQVTPQGKLAAPHFFDLARDGKELRRLPWPKEGHGAIDALLARIRSDPDAGGIPEDYREHGIPGEPRDAPPNAAPRVFEALKALGYVG